MLGQRHDGLADENGSWAALALALVPVLALTLLHLLMILGSGDRYVDCKFEYTCCAKEGVRVEAVGLGRVHVHVCIRRRWSIIGNIC